MNTSELKANKEFEGWDRYNEARKDFQDRTEKLSLFLRFIGLKIILPGFALALIVIFFAILFVAGKATFDVGKADIFYAGGSTLSIAGIILIGWRDIELPKIQSELHACKELVCSARAVIGYFDSRQLSQRVWNDRRKEIADTLRKASKRKTALRNTEFVTRHTGRIGAVISVVGILTLTFSYAESSAPLFLGLSCMP